MRGLATYTLAGLLAVTAMDFAVPGLGVSAGGWPSVSPEQPAFDQSQRVDRSRKGDRLDRTQSIVSKTRSPAPPQPLMRGCEPAFSTLTAPVEAGDLIRRCVA